MELLKNLLSIDAPSGNEEQITDFIKNEIKDYVDEISVDALGNLIALKRGSVSHNNIMLTSNVDEPGLMATVVEDSGFVRFSLIGDIKPSALLHRKVKFQNGALGVIGSEKEEGFTVKDMYIDPMGTPISVGDVASFQGDVSLNNDYICAKSLSSRIGAYVLISTIQSIKECTNDLYFVFTVQAMLGHRGAKTATFSVEPDLAIHVGVTPAFDVPCDEKSCCKLGNGPAIKVKDASILANPLIKEKLKHAAGQFHIPYQIEVLNKGTSDAGAIHLSRYGVPTGGLSVPVRFLHSVNEICSAIDIKNTVSILAEVIHFGGTHE